MNDRILRIPSSKAELTAKMEEAELHLRPIIEAIRDHDVGFMFVGQSRAPFRLPLGGKRTAITIIGDDFDEAFGPEGFHMPSVRRMIRASHSFAVVACEPLEPIYDSIAFAASTTRRHALLIETRPEQEHAWVELVRKLAPGRPLLVGAVSGGNP